MPERLRSWVAESRGSVVGLTGLLDRGRAERSGRSSSPRRHDWLPGASLHGLDFDY